MIGPDGRQRLDFSLLPSIASASIFWTLEEELEKRFNSMGFLQETRNRARGALMLFAQAHGHEEAWRDEAYIRAGLNEFYSIANALKREHRAARLPGEARRIEDSVNPLLHLMTLMRHVNVHTRTCTAAQHETTVIFNLGEPHEFSYTTAVINDLDAQQLLMRRETRRRYATQDLERVVSWFSEKQRVFGVSQLLTRGTELYCREILDCY